MIGSVDVKRSPVVRIVKTAAVAALLLLTGVLAHRSYVLASQGILWRNRSSVLRVTGDHDFARSELFSEGLYQTIEASRTTGSSAPILLLLNRALCSACDDSLAAWTRRLSSAPPTSLEVWLVNLDWASHASRELIRVLAARDIAYRVLTISDQASYRTITGVERVPLAIVAARSGPVRCVIDGLADDSAVADCGARPDDPGRPLLLVRKPEGQLAFPPEAASRADIGAR